MKGLKGIDYGPPSPRWSTMRRCLQLTRRKKVADGLKDYNEKGYVTLADERSGSRTAEYSYDDSPSPRLHADWARQKKLLFTPVEPTTSSTFGTRT